MLVDSFHKLKEWYKLQCDGVWEHRYGISIETLDNPGWRVKIDIQHIVHRIDNFNRIEEDGTNWINIKIENGVFIGDGDADSLERILLIFIDLIESHRTP